MPLVPRSLDPHLLRRSLAEIELHGDKAPPLYAILNHLAAQPPLSVQERQTLQHSPMTWAQLLFPQQDLDPEISNKTQPSLWISIATILPIMHPYLQDWDPRRPLPGLLPIFFDRLWIDGAINRLATALLPSRFTPDLCATIHDTLLHTTAPLTIPLRCLPSETLRSWLLTFPQRLTITHDHDWFHALDIMAGTPEEAPLWRCCAERFIDHSIQPGLARWARVLRTTQDQILDQEHDPTSSVPLLALLHPGSSSAESLRALQVLTTRLHPWQPLTPIRATLTPAMVATFPWDQQIKIWSQLLPMVWNGLLPPTCLPTPADLEAMQTGLALDHDRVPIFVIQQCNEGLEQVWAIQQLETLASWYAQDPEHRQAAYRSALLAFFQLDMPLPTLPSTRDHARCFQSPGVFTPHDPRPPALAPIPFTFRRIS